MKLTADNLLPILIYMTGVAVGLLAAMVVWELTKGCP